VTGRRFRYGHPHFGIEFDWLGHDVDGAVGLFMSAGYGPVPRAAYDQFKELDDELGAAITVLPTIGGSRLEQHPSITTSYEGPAQRGLYCYDWEHWKGPYRRASLPDVPLALEALPFDLFRFAVLVQVPVTFETFVGINLLDLGVEVAVQPGPDTS
jgi:hypothetical protein